MLDSVRNSRKWFDVEFNTQLINEELFIALITRVSKLVEDAPEIMEIDLNPLLANMNEIIAVDARISVLHQEQK